MDFILLIVHKSIQFIDQYKEENIFIKGRVNRKRDLFGNLKVTLAVDHKKTEDVETLKTSLCPKNHQPFIPQYTTIRLRLTLSIYSVIFLQV